MNTSPQSLVNKKDYFLISFIGVSFALFSIPILQNINLPFIQINPFVIFSLIIFFVILANLGLWLSALIARKIPIILQIAKYGAVGVFNTFLDWGVVNILMVLTAVSKGLFFSIFSGLGFIIANVGSFFWNKYWTFTSDGKVSKNGNLGQFFTISIIGLGIKVGIASLTVNVIGAPDGFTDEQWANIGNVCGTIFSMVWNFFGYKFWVFKK